MIDLANTARQQINSLEVFVIAVGPTSRWNVVNIDGMAGSTDRVWYVESAGDVATVVNQILDVLCNRHAASAR